MRHGAGIPNAFIVIPLAGEVRGDTVTGGGVSLFGPGVSVTVIGDDAGAVAFAAAAIGAVIFRFAAGLPFIAMSPNSAIRLSRCSRSSVSSALPETQSFLYHCVPLCGWLLQPSLCVMSAQIA